MFIDNIPESVKSVNTVKTFVNDNSINYIINCLLINSLDETEDFKNTAFITN